MGIRSARARPAPRPWRLMRTECHAAFPGVPSKAHSPFARRESPVRGRNSPAVGFQRLTSCVGNGRFSGISRLPKKLQKFCANPLAPEGPFWYIIHPSRPKGARSILENRTVLKERDPAAPRNDGEPPEGTRNTMNEKLVVRCPEPARAPKNSNSATLSCRNKIFFLRV